MCPPFRRRRISPSILAAPATLRRRVVPSPSAASFPPLCELAGGHSFPQARGDRHRHGSAVELCASPCCGRKRLLRARLSRGFMFAVAAPAGCRGFGAACPWGSRGAGFATGRRWGRSSAVLAAKGNFSSDFRGV